MTKRKMKVTSRKDHRFCVYTFLHFKHVSSVDVIAFDEKKKKKKTNHPCARIVANWSKHQPKANTENAASSIGISPFLRIVMTEAYSASRMVNWIASR